MISCIQVSTEYTHMLSVNSEKLNTLICKSYFADTSVSFYLEPLKHFLYA